MSIVRRAVVDIGTNSVKLLVADVRGRDVRPLIEQSEQTRLGRGFYETMRLLPESIAHTARAVAAFVAEARRWQPALIRLIATSAARDAVNQAELTTAIEGAAGLPLEIITGEQEANWVFHGVTSDKTLADRALLILDVGGGSTEFILGENAAQHFRDSFPLGTVRLLEELRPADPPGATGLERCRARIGEFLAHEVAPELRPALRSLDGRVLQLVGTGGTTTILARMELRMTDFNRERLDGLRLSRERIRALVEQLWSLPLSERRQLAGLPANRADVILVGAAIYEAVMQQFDLPELRVSTRGLRFAVVMEPGSQDGTAQGTG